MNILSRPVLLALSAALFLPASAPAAEKAVQPSITASLEYNDNIFASRSDREEDYITRVTPGFAARYEAARATVNASYFFDWINFARHGDQSLEAHKAALRLDAEIIRNTFFLKVADNYGRVSKDVSRERLQESLILNQTDSNVLAVEPYIVLRPSSWVSVRAGYRYSDYWYKDEDSVDKTDSAVFISSAFELSQKTSGGLRAEYGRQSNRIADFDRVEAGADFKYDYAAGASLTASAGYSKLKFDDGRDVDSPVWNVAVNHDFGYFGFAFTTSGKITEDPQSVPKLEYAYTAALTKEAGPRTVLTLSHTFSDYVNTETDERETRRYGFTAGLKYDITSRLAYSASLTREKFALYLQNTTTFRTLFSQTLNYSLGENTAVKLIYNYLDYESPGIESDNHETHRAVAEVAKSF